MEKVIFFFPFHCKERKRILHLIPIIDHTCKMVLGWAVGDRAVTELALRVWEYARETLIDYGVDMQGFTLHHDQDPVFTGYRWTAQLLLKDHVRDILWA